MPRRRQPLLHLLYAFLPVGAMLVQRRSSFAMGWKEGVVVDHPACKPSYD